MALTVTKATNDPRPSHIAGDVKVWLGTITFDSSYPTNGELIAASDFGMKTIIFVAVNSASSVAGKTVYWDQANSKLKVFAESAGVAAEAANASDQSLVTIGVVVFGL